MASDRERSSEQLSSDYEETSQESAGRAAEQREALQRYREVMYQKQKDAVMFSAQCEIDDYNKYAPFEINRQIVLLDDDSEDNLPSQDVDMLEM